jgi:hypothetical protein
MHLETEPKRSSERHPQFIEDPVHRFGPYYPGENLRTLIILSCFTIGEVVELQVPCKTVYHGLLTWSTTLCGDLKTIGITKPCTYLQSPEKSLPHAVSHRGVSPGSGARFLASLPAESPQVLHPLPTIRS